MPPSTSLPFYVPNAKAVRLEEACLKNTPAHRLARAALAAGMDHFSLCLIWERLTRQRSSRALARLAVHWHPTVADTLQILDGPMVGARASEAWLPLLDVPAGRTWLTATLPAIHAAHPEITGALYGRLRVADLATQPAAPSRARHRP